MAQIATAPTPSPKRASPRLAGAGRERDKSLPGSNGAELSQDFPKSPTEAPASRASRASSIGQLETVVKGKDKGPRIKTEEDQTGAAGVTQVSGSEALVDERDLSEYEKMRRANIRRNNALLEALEIPASAIPVAEGAASQKKTCKKRKSLFGAEEAGAAGAMEPRRSGRRMALAEKEKGEVLVALPDSWDETDEAKTAARKRISSLQELQDLQDTDWHALEPPPSMHQVLDELAQAQAHAVKKWSVGDWQQFAVDKWGPLVGRGKVHDWQAFVTRCNCMDVRERDGGALMGESEWRK